jgi:N-acetylglucosamine kinase-like BadF-type ATPase
MQRMENALRESLVEALKGTGHSIPHLTHACLGMTGSMDPAREIFGRIAPACQVVAYEDTVTALAGASLAQSGVIVIAGTGAIAYGRLPDGREAVAGGWGYIVGDEGSGYDIGRAALRVASQASDGRGKPTRLFQAILDHFGVATLWDARIYVSDWETTRPRVAGLAKVVAEVAQQGDEVARLILTAAAHELAKAAVAVIERLAMADVGMMVFTTGGVFQAGDLVLNPFREYIALHSPAASIHAAAYTPVVGALFLALKEAGVMLDRKVIEAVQKSLPDVARSKQNVI